MKSSRADLILLALAGKRERRFQSMNSFASKQPRVCHAIDSALRELKESGEAHVDVVILEALTQEMDEMISDGTLHSYYKQHVVGTTFFIYLGIAKN